MKKSFFLFKLVLLISVNCLGIIRIITWPLKKTFLCFKKPLKILVFFEGGNCISYLSDDDINKPNFKMLIQKIFYQVYEKNLLNKYFPEIVPNNLKKKEFSYDFLKNINNRLNDIFNDPYYIKIFHEQEDKFRQYNIIASTSLVLLFNELKIKTYKRYEELNQNN